MKFALIGEKLGHSYSATLHGLCGLTYDLVELPPDRLSDFVRAKEYAGYNVTIPYKKAIIPLLDEITEEARLAGAVNTVKNVNGKLIGHNTDVAGLRYLIASKGISVRDKVVSVRQIRGAFISRA